LKTINITVFGEIKDGTGYSAVNIVMFIVFNYQRQVGSMIPPMEPLDCEHLEEK
jgi:hypothetical protein